MPKIITLGLCDALDLFDRRMAARCDIVVLPELADGGYAALARERGIHTSGDAYLEQWRRLSKDLPITIVPGSCALKTGKGDCTNTTFVFSGGKTLLRYDKINLFPLSHDEEYFRKGNSLPSVPVKVGASRVRMGVMLCYDLRFPEISRGLARQGTGLLVVPARWPRERLDAWRTLIKARAMENQLFVAGCNARGKEGGPSFVADPSGMLLKPGRDSARGWKIFHLELRRINEVRSRFDTHVGAAIRLR